MLEAQHVTKIYYTKGVLVHALDSIKFELYRGEIVMFLDPTNSGSLAYPNEGGINFKLYELTTFDDQALTGYKRFSWASYFSSTTWPEPKGQGERFVDNRDRAERSTHPCRARRSH